MRPTDLPLVTLDGRHAGELLAHPCACDQPLCKTIGEHLWASTRDMVPGPRAQAFEPRMIVPSFGPSDSDPPPDPTNDIHRRYQDLLDGYRAAAMTLTRFIDSHRPDRWVPLPEPATESDACRNHIDVIGVWEPRSKGDLCEFCLSYVHATNRVPSEAILRARHEGRYREVDRLVAQDAAEAAHKKKSKRKRAS